MTTSIPRLAAALALAAAAVPALAEQVLGVTTDGRLVAFDTADPGTLLFERGIRGTQGTVVAIDVRPADGRLYAVTDSARLYVIDPATGDAVQVGSGAFAAPLGQSVGMAVHPLSDRIRVVTADDRNLRVDPATGRLVDGDETRAGVQGDAPLAYLEGDRNFRAEPSVVAIAYTGPTAAEPSGELFGIDVGRDVLVRIDPPGSGALTTVGDVGQRILDLVGFDVSRTTPEAFAVATAEGDVRSTLYRVSLGSGGMVPIGEIGAAGTLRAMAIGPAAGPVDAPRRALVGLTDGGDLVRFWSDAPETITRRTEVTGLEPGDRLVAIDVRPSTGRLYGLGAAGRLYVVHSVTGVASSIGTEPFDVSLSGTAFALAFDPGSPGIARIATDAGLNLRVAADTGRVVDADRSVPGTQTDRPFAFGADDVNEGAGATVVGAAFGRPPESGVTSMFAVEAGRDVLVLVGSEGGVAQSPDTGRLHTVGSLGVDVRGTAAFDVAPDGVAFLAVDAAGDGSVLHVVDLRTGTAARVGDVGSGETLVGLTLAPTSNPVAPGQEFVALRGSVRLDFDDPSRDALTLTGRIPLPEGDPDGAVVTVDFGGHVQTFTLNGRRRARETEGTRPAADDDRFSLVGPVRDGNLLFRLTLRREDLAAALADDGLAAGEDARGERRTVALTITIGGTTHTVLVPLRWFARAGRSGVGVVVRP